MTNPDDIRYLLLSSIIGGILGAALLGAGLLANHTSIDDPKYKIKLHRNGYYMKDPPTMHAKAASEREVLAAELAALLPQEDNSNERRS